MIKSIPSFAIIALVAMHFLAPSEMMAQGRGEGRGEGRGGRGGFNMEEFRARMMDRMKEQFGFSDAEFKAILPLIEEVQEKQRAARSGGGMSSMMSSLFGRGGRGGEGRGGERGRGRGGSPELEALQGAIESGANIEAKLKDFRAARAKKEAALKNSQDTLKAVLTVKQEAVAVMVGLIP
ncbi:MAG: hypothetical protein P8L18_09010 [Verrucomicrobiota bacterium]|nr:hypothetical protein [Verrucomicrobiota bacterium]